jgi:hypothetical protein
MHDECQLNKNNNQTIIISHEYPLLVSSNFSLVGSTGLEHSGHHDSVCPFVLFLFVVMSVLLRYMDSDNPFAIFKLFLIHYGYFIRRHYNTEIKQLTLEDRHTLNFRKVVVVRSLFIFRVTLMSLTNR